MGWWPANGNANDVVGGHHGALVNGAGYSRGIAGAAFDLDGNDQWVDVPDAPALNFGTGDFTVALWVAFDSLIDEQILVEKWVQKYPASLPTSKGWVFTKLGHGALRMALSGVASIGEFDLDTAPLTFVPHTWHHVVARRAGDVATIFLDGVAAASAAIPAVIDVSSTSTLKFGHRGIPSDTPGSEEDLAYGCYLNGRVDEVKLFDRGLTDQEIRASYESGGH